MNASMRALAAALILLSSATGHGASISDSVFFALASGAAVCHNSSVMKGISGWFRRSATSSTRTRVRRVARCWASLPPWICTLASSTYQSQYSFQMNS